MKVLSVASIFCFFLSLQLIEAQFDGQFTCAFGKNRRRRRFTEEFASSLVSKKHVKFYLYTKEQTDRGFDPVELKKDDLSLFQGNFDTSKLTKIFIHGYKSHRDTSASRVIREGFFKNGDFNVIIVDWSKAQHKGVILWAYDSVVKKLNAVGEHVGNMLRFLEDNGVDLSSTTVVGHSLGAHVAGIAGHRVDSKIGRIVGLDPAGPLISTRVEENRLTKDDAVQVEVIHSEIDQCGLKNQMGHYDFYPNSGRNQPGCPSNFCSHARSYHFFAESLDPNSKGFYGKMCDDWWDMQKGDCNGEVLLMGGLDKKSGKPGIYYLKTNNEAPYAQGPP